MPAGKIVGTNGIDFPLAVYVLATHRARKGAVSIEAITRSRIEASIRGLHEMRHFITQNGKFTPSDNREKAQRVWLSRRGTESSDLFCFVSRFEHLRRTSPILHPITILGVVVPRQAVKHYQAISSRDEMTKPSLLMFRETWSHAMPAAKFTAHRPFRGSQVRCHHRVPPGIAPASA